MEDQQQQSNNSSLFQLNLDASNSYTLRSAGSWAKVLGVVGIIFGALIIIMAIIALNKAGNSYEYSNREGIADVLRGSRGDATLGATLLIITGVIFILGAIFSYNFGNRINMALKANDQEGLEKGFAALRNYYALRGIVLIIVLLLFLVSFASML